MPVYTWFKIFNKVEFLALGLISKTYTWDLEGIGLKEILVTNGQGIGMVYDGVFLPLQLNDANPFAIDQRAIYIDANNDVFLGIEVVDA